MQRNTGKLITIIDYGLGNLGSVSNILKRLGIPNIVTSDNADIEQAQKLILPGVGAFDNGMENLNQLGLSSLVKRKVLDEQTPILGICLGAQLMLNRSEEGKLPGLGLLGGKVVKFKSDLADGLRVPHMGWNTAEQIKKSALFEEMPQPAKFYFVHSYHFELEDYNAEWLSTYYGYMFCSAFISANIAGVQFHPEKSHKFGMCLLRNFAEKW